MKGHSELFVGFYLVFGMFLIGLAGYGWVMNIVKLVPMDGLVGMMLLRAVGIFVAPLGAVLGYIG